MRMQTGLFLVLLLFVTAMVIPGCRDNDDFFTMGTERTIKKQIAGTWNIERMEVWFVDDMQSNSIVDTANFQNVGTMAFREDMTMDLSFTPEVFDAKYVYLYSLANIEWDYIAGTLTIGDPWYGNVMYLDKKEMKVLMPWTLNSFLTDHGYINLSVEFRFTLKKQ